MRIGKWSDAPMACMASAVVAAIAVFFFFAIGGCEVGIGERDQKDIERLPMMVEVLIYRGHEYLWAYHGGITHTESCKCRESEVVK